MGQYGYMIYEQHALSAELNRVAASRPAVPEPAREVENEPERLVIPSIHLDDVVVRGTDYRDLLRGPGMLDGSPLPGEIGNSVIAGHRDTYFRHVSDLKLGDTILVERDGATYRFTVESRQIVRPQQTSVLGPTPDAVLTLVTCYPTYWVGPAPKRLIVRAKYDGETPAAGG